MNDSNSAGPGAGPVVRDKKERVAPEPILYGGFDAVRNMANGLIAKYHPELSTAHFLFVSRSKAAKSGGRLVPGKVSKVSPIYRYLTIQALKDQEENPSMDSTSLPEADFVMEVALDVWNDYAPTKRAALIDHLLARCVGLEDEKTGEMRYSIRQPSVQEFPDIADRHGVWTEELNEMRASLKDKL